MSTTITILVSLVQALPQLIAEVETDIAKIQSDTTTQSRVRDIASAVGQLIVTLAKDA